MHSSRFGYIINRLNIFFRFYIRAFAYHQPIQLSNNSRTVDKCWKTVDNPLELGKTHEKSCLLPSAFTPIYGKGFPTIPIGAATVKLVDKLSFLPVFIPLLPVDKTAPLRPHPYGSIRTSPQSYAGNRFQSGLSTYPQALLRLLFN